MYHMCWKRQQLTWAWSWRRRKNKRAARDRWFTELGKGRENRGQKENADDRRVELAAAYEQKTDTETITSQKTGVCQLDWKSFQKSPRNPSIGWKSGKGEGSQREIVGNMPKERGFTFLSLSLASAHVLWRMIHLPFLHNKKTHMAGEEERAHERGCEGMPVCFVIVSVWLWPQLWRAHFIKAAALPRLVSTDRVNR